MAAILDEDGAWEKAFRGFYFFDNTASVYPTTVMALPSMLSGKVYKNEIDKEVYLNEVFHNNEFVQSLEANNYQSDFPTLNVYCGGARLKNCAPIFTGAADALKYEFIDLALFKSVPDIIKPYVHNDERWLIRSRFSKSQYSASQNGNAYLLWRKYIDEINNSASRPSYKFFHSLITHSPMMFEADCSLYESSKGYSLDDRRQQGICGLRQVMDFLERLRELGVYENSFIILSSDHGSTFIPPETGKKPVAGEISPQHYALSRALLMIKPMDSNEGFVRTRRPASLLDIPNTILENNNIGSIDGGVNIFSLSEDAERKRQYIYYDWLHEYWGKSTLPPLEIYEINGPIDDPNSWSLDHGRVGRATTITRELKCGEQLKFNQDLDEDFVSTVGLSSVESWGRWSDRSKVFIRFRHGDVLCENQGLNIRARAFVIKENPHVSARVLLNGQDVGVMSFHESERGRNRDQPFAFGVNGALKKKAVNELQMEIDGANSPALLGFNADGRIIGLALEELWMD